MTKNEIALVLAVTAAIVETIKEAGPDGAPSSSLYLAVSERGMTLHQYENLMSMMVLAGKVKRQGHVYFAV